MQASGIAGGDRPPSIDIGRNGSAQPSPREDMEPGLCDRLGKPVYGASRAVKDFRSPASKPAEVFRRLSPRTPVDDSSRSRRHATREAADEWIGPRSLE